MMTAIKRSVATALVAGAALIAAACDGAGEHNATAGLQDGASYSFRNDERPVYAKTIAPQELQKFLEQGGRVLDVRLAEDFEADPFLIPGADRGDPDKIAVWAKGLPKGVPVAVYCVKGKWVSQKAAAYLADRGIDAFSVAGGLQAWRAASAQP
jgi:rhodanese-related sulfurtransferase